MRLGILLLILACAACRPPGRPGLTASVPPPQLRDTPIAATPTPASDAASSTVVEQAPPPPLLYTPARNNRAFVAETNSRLRDAYFDYERAGLRPDAAEALRFDYELLRGLLADFPDLRVVVEGHCDERGSAEYNLALGDRRANQAIDYLVQLGLPAAKLSPVTYGRERPQCTEASESCWQKNRRAHLVAVDRLAP